MKKICSITLFLALCSTAVHGGSSDYNAQGFGLGSFIVKSKISLGIEHNDNIYATTNNALSDTITVVSPEVAINSTWSSHALDISGNVKNGLYASSSKENYLDANLQANGRLDVLRESFLTGATGIHQLHEERGSPDSKKAWTNPAEYTTSNMDLNYHHGLGRTSLSGGTGITKVDYNSVNLIGGGTEDLNIRDRNLYNLNARVTYELLPSVKPFLVGHYDWRVYNNEEAQRDSTGYRLGLGTGIDLGGITTAEVFAGYMQQDYDYREGVNGRWFGLNLLWEATQLTSVKSHVQSSVKETTQTGSSGINAIDAGLRVDHELLRNLLIGGYFDYTHNDYQTTNITDQVYTFGPRLTYLVNRYLNCVASYADKTRGSSDLTREYTEQIFMLSLTGQY